MQRQIKLGLSGGIIWVTVFTVHSLFTLRNFLSIAFLFYFSQSHFLALLLLFLVLISFPSFRSNKIIVTSLARSTFTRRQYTNKSSLQMFILYVKDRSISVFAIFEFSIFIRFIQIYDNERLRTLMAPSFRKLFKILY